MGVDPAGPVAIGPYAGYPVDEALRRMATHQRGHLGELKKALEPARPA
jgi:hypothetical protein